MKLKAEKSLFQIPQAEKYLSAILPRLAEKRVQSFTTITLSLVTLSFFGIFAISPTLSTIADLQKQISDSQFVNDQLSTKIINLTNLQVSYKQIQKSLPVLFNAIPYNPDVTVLIGQLQQIAKQSNVTLNHVQTLPVDVSNSTNTKYNSYSFALDVSGSSEDIQNFLNTIVNFNRLITVDAVSLSQSSTITDSYTLSFRGKAYFKTQ